MSVSNKFILITNDGIRGLFTSSNNTFTYLRLIRNQPNFNLIRKSTTMKAPTTFLVCVTILCSCNKHAVSEYNKTHQEPVRTYHQLDSILTTLEEVGIDQID